MQTISQKFFILVAGLFCLFISCEKEKTLIIDGDKESAIVELRSRSKRNRPPVVNAGPDQTIILPTNTAALDSSASTDTNNNISGY